MKKTLNSSFFLAFKYIFFPNPLFPIWYIKVFFGLDNLQDWMTLLVTKAFWWMVLSYFFFSSMNIFLKHAILSYYWDSSLSEIKSLFYFLHVLTSSMYPNIFVFQKTFFFSTKLLRLLFPSSATSFFPLSISKDAITFKNPSKFQSLFQGFTM